LYRDKRLRPSHSGQIWEAPEQTDLGELAILLELEYEPS